MGPEGAVNISGRTFVARENDFPGFSFGEEYFLFLRQGEGAQHNIVGGRQGAYRVSHGSVPMFTGRPTDPEVPVSEFTRGVRAEIERQSQPEMVPTVVGGEIPDGRGYFVPPTVLGNVPDDARVFHEEIFGPVAPVGGFDSEEDAIARANDTEYGLVAYVFTRDIKRALRVCEGLETGMVGLNQGMVSNAGAPFGGVKQSGIGREGGKEGLEEFLETKYVAVNL